MTFPIIPKFHKGGIVKRNTLALIKRGCVVRPSPLHLCSFHFGQKDTILKDHYWAIETQYCYECKRNLQKHLRDKSIKKLLKMSFIEPELRLHIRKELQTRKEELINKCESTKHSQIKSFLFKKELDNYRYKDWQLIE